MKNERKILYEYSKPLSMRAYVLRRHIYSYTLIHDNRYEYFSVHILSFVVGCKMKSRQRKTETCSRAGWSSSVYT